jgi:hypothetical protein
MHSTFPNSTRQFEFRWGSPNFMGRRDEAMDIDAGTNADQEDAY